MGGLVGGRHESHWTSTSAKENIPLSTTILYSERKVCVRLKPIRTFKGLKTKDDKGVWSLLC